MTNEDQNKQDENIDIDFLDKGEMEISEELGISSETDDSISGNNSHSPETFNLKVQYDPQSPKVNDEVTFQVVDEYNKPVRGVSVSTDNSLSGTTDEDGTITLTFREARKYEITVSKTVDDDSVEYFDQTVPLQIRENESELYVDETRGDFVEGEEVKVRIINDSGNGVENVKVGTNQSHMTTTNKTGWATLELTESGDLELIAYKDDDNIKYETLKEVFSVDEKQREILMKGIPPFASPGETVTIRVVDDDDRPIKGAEINSTNQQDREWVTDAQGNATVELMNSTGTETLIADKPGVIFANGTAEEQIDITRNRSSR